MRLAAALALTLAVPASLGLSTAAIAQEKSATKPGFSFPTGKPVRVVVFRPDVSVGSQSTGGLDEPNADWTATAKTELVRNLDAAMRTKADGMTMMPELTGEDARTLADYRALFKAVTGTIVAHRLFVGNRLPTKLDKFDWSLGPGVAKLAGAAGGEPADYGLFFLTQDSYGSAGRKALQVIGLLTGFGVTTSGVHIGYAGLVDMKTGELVWINADLGMGGDVREPDGAAKRVAQLLEDFPIRAGTARATTAAK